jgi:hypothetical protein
LRKQIQKEKNQLLDELFVLQRYDSIVISPEVKNVAVLGKVLLIPKVVVNEEVLLKFYSIYNVCKRIKVTLMYMELKCD